MENNKGCVYFFRHIGLTPVKIGYSNSESPIGRFEQFKTFAPYGSEIIGFIRTYDAKQLETTLHERFSAFRLSGEWFDITQEQCESVISFYSNIEDIKEKNEFQIEWAKKVEFKYNNNQIEGDVIFNELILKYGFGNKISNFDLNAFYKLKSNSNIHIKSIKSLLRAYCKHYNYFIVESVTNSQRYFIISK